jgi:hypothetical protein
VKLLIFTFASSAWAARVHATMNAMATKAKNYFNDVGKVI